MKNWLWILVFSLVACTTRQPLNGTAIDDMNVELHQDMNQNAKLSDKNTPRNANDISRALLPHYKFRSPEYVDYGERRFDVAVKDVLAPTFYMGLVKDTRVSIVVSPEIKGNVTLSLKNVTVEQVLAALEDAYGYTYVRTSGGFEILPNNLQTQIYAVNYLELQRSGNSDMRLHSGEVTEVVQGSGGGGASSGTPGGPSTGSGATSIQGSIGRVKTESTIDFWEQLKLTLENIIGKDDNHSVTVNKIAGVVVVRAYPKELKQVEAYLDLVQNNMNRQVILEAKILEVTLNDRYQMGIDWHAYGLTQFYYGFSTNRN